jgi:hypothetical protein
LALGSLAISSVISIGNASGFLSAVALRTGRNASTPGWDNGPDASATKVSMAAYCSNIVPIRRANGG